MKHTYENTKRNEDEKDIPQSQKDGYTERWTNRKIGPNKTWLSLSIDTFEVKCKDLFLK